MNIHHALMKCLLRRSASSHLGLNQSVFKGINRPVSTSRSLHHTVSNGCNQSVFRGQPIGQISSQAEKSWLASKTSFRFISSRILPPAGNPLLTITQKENGLVPCSRGMKADTDTTSLTIWEDVKELRKSPNPALALGLAGLIPFLASPACMIFSHTFLANIASAQAIYGACILSFLGGVRWGFVLPEGGKLQADWFNLGYSVVPSLVACVALLLPMPYSNLMVMGGIAGAAYVDTAVKGYPSWFKGLRFVLSLGAVLSLWTVFLCHYLLPTSQPKAT